MIFADGAIYEGDLEDGKAEDRGRFAFVSGDINEGDYKNDGKKG
jgi:hypothetical protein